MKNIIFILSVILLIVSCGDKDTNEEDSSKVKWGTKYNDIGKSSTFDKDKNIFVVGDSNGSFSDNNKNDKIFVTKFDSNGNKKWSKSYSDDDKLFATDIKVLNNDIYIVGQTARKEGTGEIPKFKTSIFIIKLNQEGKKIWLKKISEIDARYNRRVVDIDIKDDRFYLFGDTNGNEDNSAFLDSKDLFLITLNNNGEELDNKIWGTSKDDFAEKMIFNNDKDNLYLTGITRGTFTAEDISIGGDDIFVSNMSNGEILWSKIVGTTQNDSISDINIDSENNIYILGDTLGIVENQKGKRDIFLIKLNLGGFITFQKQFGTSEDDFASNLLIDNSIYILGNTLGSFDEKLGKKDIFLLNLDLSGNEVSKKQFGTPEDDIAFSLLKNEKMIYIFGMTISTKSDLFLIKESY